MTEGLDVRAVTKRFGSVTANQSVTLRVRPGTIHALLGENGAGKSSLVAMINGGSKPDEGSISFDGHEIDGSRHIGPELGIATVHQELALVPAMTGLENIALALGRAADRSLRVLANEVQQTAGTFVNLDRPVWTMELPQRQRIELIKALCTKPRLLILDEPTTFLPPAETEPFLDLVRRLARDGMGVLLITHRLEEAAAIADEVTVLRRGAVVQFHPGPGLPGTDELARQIVGVRVAPPTHARGQLGKPILRVAGLCASHGGLDQVSEIDLTVREGEILGLAGVDGNGQMELLETLAGLRNSQTGTIELNGVRVENLPVKKRIDRGLQYVSGERKRDAIVPGFSIAEHFDYALGRDPSRNLPEILSRFDVRPPLPNIRADGLSGGNQQKLVMARALQRTATVLMVSYPTQGLDVLAGAQLRQMLISHAEEGASVIIASSDLDELLDICDSVAVMNGGRIVGTQNNGAFERDELAAWYTGSPARPGTPALDAALGGVLN
jgi:ABC-type uncharacterized transport system ATPase subunit